MWKFQAGRPGGRCLNATALEPPCNPLPPVGDTFSRMLQAARAEADTVGDSHGLVAVDSTIVRAHQHADRT